MCEGAVQITLIKLGIAKADGARGSIPDLLCKVTSWGRWPRSQLLIPDRNKLVDETMEMCKLLKSWQNLSLHRDSGQRRRVAVLQRLSRLATIWVVSRFQACPVLIAANLVDVAFGMQNGPSLEKQGCSLGITLNHAIIRGLATLSRKAARQDLHYTLALFSGLSAPHLRLLAERYWMQGAGPPPSG